MPGDIYDAVIIGGGTAGCVLASRLSEDPGKRVLLVEAGADNPAGSEHPDILDPFPVSIANPDFAWPGLIVEVGADPGNGQPRFSRPFLQGRGVGGTSNLQGMAALRGLPEDYDEWSDQGVEGWAWSDVLPYFRKLERDLDFSGPAHGADGPIPVRRVARQDWAPYAKAVGQAFERRGFRFVEDCNADFQAGFSPTPIAGLPGQRVSASMGYLDSAVRRRPNLAILANAQVQRIEVKDGRATGVTVLTGEGEQRIAARQTVVSCGGLFSPAVLMRSGIGPATHLKSVGVDVVHDLAGVGRNLQNHPEITLVMHLPEKAAQPPEYPAWQQNCLFYSSGNAGCPQHDMFVSPANKAGWHPLGRRIGIMRVAIFKPFSRGTVELRSASADTHPEVRSNLLGDSRDFGRMVDGLRFAFELLADRDVAAVRNEIFLPDGRLVARLGRRNPLNFLQTWAIARLFDIAPLRRALLRKTTLDAVTASHDDAMLERLVRQLAQPTHHVSGSCRMGAATDPEAVVDSTGRVHGIEGLRVADASIFPTLMRANTHIPVLMAAEKIADHIRAEWHGHSGAS